MSYIRFIAHHRYAALLSSPATAKSDTHPMTATCLTANRRRHSMKQQSTYKYKQTHTHIHTHSYTSIQTHKYIHKHTKTSTNYHHGSLLEYLISTHWHPNNNKRVRKRAVLKGQMMRVDYHPVALWLLAMV